MGKDLFSLTGKVAVITGGAGDLGFAIAKAYVEAGAIVVLVGRDYCRLSEAITRLGPEAQANVAGIATDVSIPEQVEALFEKIILRFHKVDILVTAAGAQYRHSVLDIEREQWRKVIDVNLNGTFYCAQLAAQSMRKQATGRIIMITSLTSEIGIPNISAYAASKGGVRQLCRTMSVELARDGITVNCIGPGRFSTRMTADIFADASKRLAFLSVIPMGRTGVPDDLAGVSIFLASDASSYITGQSIYVDGGWLAGCGNIPG